MRDYIEERALEIAMYIISSKTTIRDAARIFGVSKSTVHVDMTKRLPRIDRFAALKVREILDINYDEKAIRGGMATKQKYRSVLH